MLPEDKAEYGVLFQRARAQTGITIINELEESTSFKNWMSRLSPRSHRAARANLYLWTRWMRDPSHGGGFSEMSLDQLIEYQSAAGKAESYKILDRLQGWILSLKMRKSSKHAKYFVIRSFFAHNRASLPEDKGFRIRGDEPPTKGILDPEEIRKLLLSCSRTYRAVFLSMLQGGMSSDQFLYWNLHGYEALKQSLADREEIIKITFQERRKQRRNERSFYTFIGGDAIQAIREYLEERPSGKTEAIFYDIRGEPITYFTLVNYWRAHLIRCGISPRSKDRHYRTGKSLHELRDTFRSLWAKTDAKPEVGEYLMGHQIDPLGYNKAWSDERFYQAEYVKALPHLNLLSSPRAYHQISDDAIESMQAKIRGLEAQIKNFRLKEYMEKTSLTREEVEKLRALLGQGEGDLFNPYSQRMKKAKPRPVPPSKEEREKIIRDLGPSQ